MTSKPRTLDFHFDYSCPYAYLASRRVEALAERIGAPLRWKPMLLGAVFRAVGTPQNLSEGLGPSKARHNLLDMNRWAEAFEVPLHMPNGHPFRTVDALRATLAAGIDPKVIHGFYRAYWVEGRAPSEPSVIRDVLTAAGHDADAILAKLGDDAVKNDLRARTDEAIALGVFGAPTFVLDGELYWGQDRMQLIEGRATLSHPTPPAGRVKAPTLEVYWDFSSPYAYLGSTQAADVARRTGATLVWRPMLLGGLFRSIGQVDVPLATWSVAKQRHTQRDIERWAAFWGVPYRFPSRFPMNSLKAMRTWLSLPESRRDAFREATFRAYWADDRDIGDDAVLRELIGVDADEVWARTRSPEVKQALLDGTQRAAEAGVFGAPTWVVDGRDVYWGQDRIPLVERALTRV